VLAERRSGEPEIAGGQRERAPVDRLLDGGHQEVSGVRAAAAEKEFLAATGGKFLVTGLPMRRSRGERPASFVDLAAATPIADLVNRIGAATLESGVQVALHTESHSVFWTPRDIDLFMLLTDPMYVAMCPDTGHIALGGADPVQVAGRHRDRLVIAHWKDASGPVPTGLPIDETIFERRAPYFRRTGTGVVDWFGWSRLLQDRLHRVHAAGTGRHRGPHHRDDTGQGVRGHRPVALLLSRRRSTAGAGSAVTPENSRFAARGMRARSW
jgi:hypothetical protein